MAGAPPTTGRARGGERGTGLRPPAVAAALTGGLAAGVAGVVAGFVLALVFPDESLIGRVGEDASLLSEAFRQSVQILLVRVYEAPLEGDPDRLAPALLAAIPVGLCAVAGAAVAARSAGVARRARLACGAAVGIPFAFVALAAATLAGTDREFAASTGAAAAAALVWGALGGALGVAVATRPRGGRGRPTAEPSPALPGSRPAIDSALRALRMLGLTLLVAAAVGTGAWTISVLGAEDTFSDDRGPGVAVVENALYAVEHGVHLAELGLLVEFEPPTVELEQIGLPFPSSYPEDVASSLERYRIFAYRRALSPGLFTALLALASGLPLLGAALAGASIARGRGARSPLLGAAWGAVVGPVWALSVALFGVVIDKPAFGTAVTASAVLAFLLAGTALGALGGTAAAALARRPAT